MAKYEEGDKLLLHSQDGHDYKITIENINPYREPGMVYAVDMVNDQGVSYYDIYGDWLFCGEDLLDMCVMDEESDVK